VKNKIPLLTMILLGAMALGFTSCAGEQVKEPLPPVTSLNSEPAFPSDTNELGEVNARNAPLVSANPLPSQAQPRSAASAYLAIPVVSAAAPMAVDVHSGFNWSAEDLLSLIFLLLALLVLAAALRDQSRTRHSHRMVLPEGGFTPIGFLAREPALPAETITAKDTPAPFSPYRPPDAKRPLSKVHFIHPQKEIIVTAFFNGREHQMHFSPNTTIKKVTAWAIYQFEISEEDHKDAYLAIHGYSAPLINTAHLGRYVMHGKTKLELDVKTITRVSV
jgi:hypothetical protein